MKIKFDNNTWKSPPEFWDRLSKIELTRSALRELDRRTKLSRTRIPRSYHSIPQIINTPRITRAVARAIVRFANGGGPDISDLRGVCISTQSPEQEAPQVSDIEVSIPILKKTILLSPWWARDKFPTEATAGRSTQRRHSKLRQRPSQIGRRRCTAATLSST